MKKISLLLVGVLFVVAACTSTQEKNQDFSVINVDIQLPEQVEINKEITIKTHVTQGDENVEDAQDVQFEIWNVEEGKEASKQVEASHIKDGVYQVEVVLEKDGIYHVQAHVTARDMHVMPTKQLMVGSLSDEEIERILREQSEESKDEENHENHDLHH